MIETLHYRQVTVGIATFSSVCRLEGWGWGDGYWLVYFCRMSLGVLDDRRRKVWNVEAAIRKGWLAADALPSPFRCAPGTGQSVEM